MGAETKRLLAVSAAAEISGAEAVLEQYLVELAGTGWDVCCAAPPGQLSHAIAVKGIEVVQLRPMTMKGGRRIRSVAGLSVHWMAAARQLRASARTADVVLVNSLHTLGPIRLARVRSPVVWLVHDVVRRRDLAAVVRFGAPAVDLAIAVSQSAAEGPMARGIPTQVVRNGVRVDDVGAHREVGAVPVVGMAARLTPWKGHEVALRAVAAMRNQVQLQLLGGAFANDHAYAGHLRALAADLGIGDRVDFTGHVDEPRAYMRSWSIAVSASVLPEAGPLNVAEALSMGLPVVGTDHGGTAELPTDVVRLVAPGDADGLAGALDALVDDLPMAALHARSAGPAYVREHLDYGTQAARFVDVLEAVVGGTA